METVPYRIETPRLVIRGWSPEDAPALFDAENESREHLKRFMPWAHVVEPLDGILAKLARFRSNFDRGEDFMMGAFDANTGEILGGTGLHPHGEKDGTKIGYWVHPAHTRKGIATEMAGALTRIAFELGKVQWVEIRCARDNVASAGVPPKLGFVHEATLRDRIAMPGGTFADALVFTLLRRDYESSAAKRIDLRAFDGAGRRVL